MSNAITLTIRQWEEALSVIRVRDVPEPKTPGQRLYEECGPRMWHREGDAEKAAWEAKAARLGIKPEGE